MKEAALIAAILAAATRAAGAETFSMHPVPPGIAASSVITLETVGSSALGRPLSLAVAASVRARQHGAPAVLIICRQHGDEPVASQAALRVLRRLADPDDPRAREITSRLVTLVIPNANPDGAALGTRANSSGIDLNRDWILRTQPETRAVFDVIIRWRPILVVDAHEWARHDIHACNTIEVPLPAPSTASRQALHSLSQWTHRALVACASRGNYVQRTFWSPASDPRLAHRYLISAWRTPALLYETTPAGTAVDQARVSQAATFLWELLASVAATLPPPPSSRNPAAEIASAPHLAPILFTAIALLLPLIAGACAGVDQASQRLTVCQQSADTRLICNKTPFSARRLRRRVPPHVTRSHSRLSRVL